MVHTKTPPSGIAKNPSTPKTVKVPMVHTKTPLSGADMTSDGVNQKDWKRRTNKGAKWAVEGVFSSFKRILGEAVRAVKWPYVIR